MESIQNYKYALCKKKLIFCVHLGNYVIYLFKYAWDINYIIILWADVYRRDSSTRSYIFIRGYFYLYHTKIQGGIPLWVTKRLELLVYIIIFIKHLASWCFS
jgi:hypothetical protein